MLFITQPRVGISHNEILALQISAREYGWDVIPADSSWRLDEELIAKKQLGVPYGSQMFCEIIAQQMNWKLHQNAFDWLARLPKHYLKRQVDFMSLKEAKNLHVKKFIKPADDKCFDAKVYEVGTFKPSDLISEDYPVLVSEIVKWDLEYRCFVKNGIVYTWSNYLFFGEVNERKYKYMIPGDDIRPDQFVLNLLNEIGETPNCVIDIGIIHNKGWAVIETNPIWASGIYGCDPYKIIEAMDGSTSFLESK